MDTASIDSRWKWLFTIGGVAALAAAIIFRRNLGTELMLLRTTGIIHVGPTALPDTIMAWFSLLHGQWLIGLTLLNVFDMVNYGLLGVIFLALYAALRRGNESVMAIAAALGFLGIAVYLASNQAFTMLSLSGQYAAATTEAQRALLLSAGQAVLAVSNNAGYEGEGIYVGLLCVTVAGLLISIVMRGSRVFRGSTSVLGILANAFGLSYYVVLVLAPPATFLPVSISAVFLLLWYLLIGLKLLRMARS